MGKAPRYQILYSPEAVDHLRQLTARQQAIVVDTVAKQLQYRPDQQTRNRKMMDPNEVGTWELRIGDIRVYYDIEFPSRVSVRAIGIKTGSVVRIAGKEVVL